MHFNRIAILFPIVFFLMGAGCKTQPEKEKIRMAHFKGFIENTWNHQNMETFRTFSTKDYVRYLNGEKVAKNQRETESTLNTFFIGFPDTEITLDRPICKENQLFVHWRLSGTNTGQFAEVPPTGKKINIYGFAAVLWDKEGKMVQEEVFYNELDLMEQLGYTLVPPDLE